MLLLLLLLIDYALQSLLLQLDALCSLIDYIFLSPRRLVELGTYRVLGLLGLLLSNQFRLLL